MPKSPSSNQLSFESLAEWRTRTAQAMDAKKPQVIGARLPEAEFDTLESWRRQTLLNRARAEVLGVIVSRWVAILRDEGLTGWTLERLVDLMWVFCQLLRLLRRAGILEAPPETIIRSLRIEVA